MKLKHTALFGTVLFLTALLSGIAAANTSDGGDAAYPDLNAGEYEISQSIDVRENDGTVTVSGVYMASDAGYRVASANVTQADGEIQAVFEIERIDGIAAQVLTPVEFTDSVDLDHGSHDVSTTLIVDGETVHEENDTVSVTDSDGNSPQVGDYALDQVVDQQTSGAELTYEGTYTAPNAGYSVVTEDITVDGNQVDVTFALEQSDDLAAQVVTPVTFNASESLDAGDYDITVALDVDGETVHEESDSLVVEDTETTMDLGILGILIALLGW